MGRDNTFTAASGWLWDYRQAVWEATFQVARSALTWVHVASTECTIRASAFLGLGCYCDCYCGVGMDGDGDGWWLLYVLSFLSSTINTNLVGFRPPLEVLKASAHHHHHYLPTYPSFTHSAFANLITTTGSYLRMDDPSFLHSFLPSLPLIRFSLRALSSRSRYGIRMARMTRHEGDLRNRFRFSRLGPWLERSFLCWDLGADDWDWGRCCPWAVW
jgi:hypothetical protein